MGNRPLLIGYGTQFYEWIGTEWKDDHGELVRFVGPNAEIEDVVEVDSRPIIACAGKGETKILGRRQDRTWVLIATVAGGNGFGKVNALAVDPMDRKVIAVGNAVSVITMDENGKGRLEKSFAAPEQLWGAAVFRGTLFVRAARTVYRVEGHHFEVVRPESEFTTNHNHSLRAYADRLYFAREDSLEVFDGKTWTLLASDQFV